MIWIKLFSSVAEGEAKLPLHQPQLALVNGQRICLVRTSERWLAMSDRCPHNGESLSKGKLNYRGEIICPWHGYCFDAVTGREYLERSHDLETFPMDVREDGIFIGL